jgi:hypothetical protein
VPDRGEMVGGIDLVATQWLGRVVPCGHSEDNQLAGTEQQAATLFGSRGICVPLDRRDNVGRDLQLAAGTSITMAIPMPPPMQSDATPLPPPRFRNS